MTEAAPRLFTIPPGQPFLPTLAEALVNGRLIEGFDGSNAMALASATIYLPTRRAARELRSVLVARKQPSSAILPTIRALGEVDEDDAAFEPALAASLDLAPPISTVDRLLLLAELVRAWKRRLPSHMVELFGEELIIPASTADAIWHARDLAELMDEIETEGADWAKLRQLVPEDLAGWWQVTLDFLSIVTDRWPAVLDQLGQTNPAAHRNGLIRLEAERLRRSPPDGPVIAAGSTGSNPATADLLSVISRLERGAVVLPGLDLQLDEKSWSLIGAEDAEPSLFGHPQFGLCKLLRKLGATREEVVELDARPFDTRDRQSIMREAMRPAMTTDTWAASSRAMPRQSIQKALSGVTLIEAANERDEAAAIAVALKRAAARSADVRAALVTGDRNLARRVSAELLRLGVVADDSGGRPLSNTPPAQLIALLLETALRPGDPVALIGLLKHPLIELGRERSLVRQAAETIELIALRGGAGRPDIATLGALFEKRAGELGGGRRPPFWLNRFSQERIAQAHDVARNLTRFVRPLLQYRERQSVGLADIARATVSAFEDLGRSADGGIEHLYAGDAGERLADFLRTIVGAEAQLELGGSEWPDVFAALISPETVKPTPGSESRVAIWGALEARLQTVDTLVLGGLNEGIWPRRASADRFLSRVMKNGLDLEPPERRIGLAAHDFVMASGAQQLILSRAARSGDAPAVASRWLQRLLTFVGDKPARELRERGDILIRWAQSLDLGDKRPFAQRPKPTPPVELRPRRFSVTEIETLRRDPYAIYARRILGLQPLESVIRDPGPAERGILFHDILHRFTEANVNPHSPLAENVLRSVARTCFDEMALPADVEATWWPRFIRICDEFLDWERSRSDKMLLARHPEAVASALEIGATGVTLSGRADRVDRLPANMADILDYKTGSSPSVGQAHTLLAPQLALEGALLKRGAFGQIGAMQLSDLAYVRLRASGEVKHESILEFKRNLKTADALADDAWRRLEELMVHFQKHSTEYISRALPFREGDMDGDYDHLARVLEWSAGSAEAEEEGA